MNLAGRPKEKANPELEKQQREAQETAKREALEEENRAQEETQAKGAGLRGFRALLAKSGYAGFRPLIGGGNNA